MKAQKVFCHALIYSTLLLGYSKLSNAQTQKGSDIVGEAAYDWSGTYVSMPDANTIAIGAPGNDDGGSIAGHVRIYNWNGGAWIQKGEDIDGEAAQDQTGNVSMPDANTVAIGTPFNDGNGDRAGHVRVFEWIGSAWMQKGLDIDGESSIDYSGQSLSMPDANTVAIGDYSNSDNGTYAGRVRILTWSGSAWTLKGNPINGEAEFDHAGTSVSMPDANTVAIGAKYNAANGANAGHVRVFTWNGSLWVQKGIDIDGFAGSYSGSSVSMPDANTVAIGAPYYGGGGGLISVYYWDGDSWELKGSAILGVASSGSGNSVSMPDANTVAIGASAGDGNGTSSGHARVYFWDGGAWVLNGATITGDTTDDQLGIAVSMPDANTLAVGAPYGGAGEAGQVRVYTGYSLSIEQNEIGPPLVGYPNPTDGNLTLDLKSSYNEIQVIVRNILGQEMQRLAFYHTNKLLVNIDGKAGVYIVEVDADHKKSFLKVAKK